MAAFPTVVQGHISRLYPSSDRLYFNVSGDQNPPGLTEKSYNFIWYREPHFQTTYQLLLRAAEHHWTVIVRRSDAMEKHEKKSEKWTYYHVDYVYVNY